MAIGDLKDILHKIKVKLYPNYLPNTEGAYIARTDNEATLSIEEVCTTLKNRGGYQGKYDELVDNIHQFMDEMAYQLCDGYAVSTGYFSVHPNVGGTFNSDKDVHDHKKHPITFRFRTRKPLVELARTIAVEVLGLADVNGYIDEFIDTDKNSVNALFAPGNQFILHGHKIKVAGDNPRVGVYFVPIDEPERRVKVTRIAENTANKIIGIVPPSSGFDSNRIEIHTQFSGSANTFLKAPRVITSGFVIDEST
jgi:exoribonuclease R